MTTRFIHRVLVIASIGACALVTGPYDSLNLAPTLLKLTSLPSNVVAALKVA